jgi:transaldolase
VKILVASAIVEEINTIPWAPLAGIVTNPTVLLAAGSDWRATLERLDREQFPEFPAVDSMHVQCIATESDQIRGEVDVYRSLVRRRSLVAKLVVSPGALATIRQIKDEFGLRVNVTAIASLAQAQLAVESGSDFVSVYVDRLNTWGAQNGNGEQGYAVLDAIANFLARRHPTVELVAASIRDTEQYELAIATGCDAIAAPVDLLRRSIDHPLTQRGIADFAEDWRRAAAP